MKTLPCAALMLLAVASSASAQGPRGKLPPYAESIRCAGLAEAAARREKDGLAPGKAAFDTAVFWGMAASEAARKDGLSGERFTKDQEAAAAKAATELDGPGSDALVELALCVARVPPLPAAKGERG
jgi:hypothetical protein